MYKVVVLAKRKPGMTMAEFQDYYENRHSKLAEKFSPLMKKYIRSYITPVTNNMTAQGESPFDVVTESWFDSEEDMKKTMESFAANPEISETIAKDELNLFDRSTIWWFTAKHCESNL